jgi:hypothetical protein
LPALAAYGGKPPQTIRTQLREFLDDHPRSVGAARRGNRNGEIGLQTFDGAFFSPHDTIAFEDPLT